MEEEYSYILYINGDNTRGILKGKSTREKVGDLIKGMKDRNPDWVILAEEVEEGD